METGQGGDPRQTAFEFGDDDESRLCTELGRRARELGAGPYEPLPRYEPSTCEACPAARAVCPVRMPARKLRSR